MVTTTIPFTNFSIEIDLSADVLASSRPRHIFVPGGTEVRYSGSATARVDHVADGNQPFNQNGIPWHTTIASDASPQTLADGQWMVIAEPRTPLTGSPYFQEEYVNEAVLVEAVDGGEPMAPAMTYPSVVLGVTQSDAQTFLDNSHFWLETRSGWSGRRGHAFLQQGGEGYGAWMAQITGLGFLLLCSDLPPIAKVYRRVTVPPPPPGQTIYPQPDWKHMLFGSPQAPGELWLSGQSQESYRVCCTANRWCGSTLALDLMGLISGSDAQDTLDYTRWYLGWALSSLPAWQYANDDITRRLILANRPALGL